MKIYVASSFRNLNAVNLLRSYLEDSGHTVLDWAAFAPPLPAGMPLEERRRVLDGDERGDIFDFCKRACTSADLVIYLGPAGQDAAAEVGIAHAAGVPVLGLAGPLEAPGLILSRCVYRWVKDTAELFVAVAELVEPEREVRA